MFDLEYQVTHDIDYFFVLNDKPRHIASNGGVLPDILGSDAFIQNTQNEAFSLPMQFDYILNENYLNQLNPDDFPQEEEVEESGFLQTDHYTQFNNRPDMPFHWKLYCYSFVEMAKRGFWSYDRLTEYPSDEMYNARNLSSVYQLVAYPNLSESTEATYPKVGHVFKSDRCMFFLGAEKWDFAAWLSSIVN